MQKSKLLIKDKRIYLDGFEVQGVKSFGLAANEKGDAIMTLSLHVDLSELEVKKTTFTGKMIGDRSESDYST